LKCPHCGFVYEGAPQYCPGCRQPLSRKKPQQTREPADERDATSLLQQKWFMTIAVILCIAIALFGLYKIVFWIGNYRVVRLYTRGVYTPTINTITMDDGRMGHTIVFYGEDGDQIYIPELKRSIVISGGIARITIADSDWFEGDVTNVESAEIFLSPILIDERGTRTQLPGMDLTIEVPDAPLEILSPTEDNLNIVTARYELELQVVPGSTVLINNEDVTDTIDRSGLLSQNVNVQPIGDNVYNIIVRTAKHHETRRDIVIHREDYDISFEMDASVSHSSSNETMTVSGIIEPGASIEVNTGYVANSVSIDQTTGQFSFIAKFDDFGNNDVIFTVSMEGRRDAVINMVVNYKPTLAKYSSLAWRMDYEQLKKLYEQWRGQVFKCVGPIIDIVHEDGKTYFIMDVGTDGKEQIVALENYSSTTSPSLGRSYTAYADVRGHYMYNAQNYPLLYARYVDLTPLE